MPGTRTVTYSRNSTVHIPTVVAELLALQESQKMALSIEGTKIIIETKSK